VRVAPPTACGQGVSKTAQPGGQGLLGPGYNNLHEKLGGKQGLVLVFKQQSRKVSLHKESYSSLLPARLYYEYVYVSIKRYTTINIASGQM